MRLPAFPRISFVFGLHFCNNAPKYPPTTWLLNYYAPTKMFLANISIKRLQITYLLMEILIEMHKAVGFENAGEHFKRNKTFPELCEISV